MNDTSRYLPETLTLPRTKEKLAALLDYAYSSGNANGYRRATNEAEAEHKKLLATNRNAAIGQAVELLQEASKMMSRAGYLVDKANGVR